MYTKKEVSVLKVTEEIAGAGSGSVSQRYGSADLDPYQNVTDTHDPRHCLLHIVILQDVVPYTVDTGKTLLSPLLFSFPNFKNLVETKLSVAFLFNMRDLIVKSFRPRIQISIFPDTVSLKVVTNEKGEDFGSSSNH
jgi:hypothetical protein